MTHPPSHAKKTTTLANGIELWRSEGTHPFLARPGVIYEARRGTEVVSRWARRKAGGGSGELIGQSFRSRSFEDWRKRMASRPRGTMLCGGCQKRRPFVADDFLCEQCRSDQDGS